MSTSRVGHVTLDAFDFNELDRALGMAGLWRIEDGAGDYFLSHLWHGDAAISPQSLTPDIKARLPALARFVEARFEAEHIVSVRLFSARKAGFIRPHRDFASAAEPWTRFHVPLRTDLGSLNSEDDDVFHMSAGEVWLFDGGRPHGAIAFGRALRVHLIIDMSPGISLSRLFPSGDFQRNGRIGTKIERPPLSAAELDTIHALARWVTKENFAAVADALMPIHFRRHVHCSSAYAWMMELAERVGDADLIELGRQMGKRYKAFA